MSPVAKTRFLSFHTFTKILSDMMQDGSKVPAHSAVLSSIPYFEAKLRGEGSGTDWNLNKKLDLHLPCPVNRKGVQAFLKYAYGDFSSLRQIESSDARSLQVGDKLGVSSRKRTVPGQINEEELLACVASHLDALLANCSR
jgi:hypothetical protein